MFSTGDEAEGGLDGLCGPQQLFLFRPENVTSEFSGHVINLDSATTANHMTYWKINPELFLHRLNHVDSIM